MRAIFPLLLLASCATPPEPRIVYRDGAIIDRPVPCMSRAQYDAIMALAPGAIGPWLPDARQREGVALKRMSQYRSFRAAVEAVLPGNCVGG